MTTPGMPALAWWEQARRWLATSGLWVVGCAIVVWASYCAGDAHGATQVRTATADSVRRALADSSHAIEARLQARAPVLATVERHTDTVRVRYRADSARVVVVSDTTVRVDSLVVPVLPAIAERIRASDSLVTALSRLDSVHVAQLVDVTADRDAWKARAGLDESVQPHPPRLGFRSGLVAGALVVLGVLHFVK